MTLALSTLTESVDKPEYSLQDIKSSLLESLQSLEWHEFKTTMMQHIELQRSITSDATCEAPSQYGASKNPPPHHATYLHTHTLESSQITIIEDSKTVASTLPGAAKSAMAEGGYYKLLARRIRARNGCDAKQFDT